MIMLRNINNKMCACNGICHKYKAVVDRILMSQGFGAYIQGFKRCRICNIFLTVDGIGLNEYGNTLCKCCGNRVSAKPRRKSAKEKQHDRKHELVDLKITEEKMLREII